jgi:hypothetical protein
LVVAPNTHTFLLQSARAVAVPQQIWHRQLFLRTTTPALLCTLRQAHDSFFFAKFLQCHPLYDANTRRGSQFEISANQTEQWPQHRIQQPAHNPRGPVLSELPDSVVATALLQAPMPACPAAATLAGGHPLSPEGTTTQHILDGEVQMETLWGTPR